MKPALVIILLGLGCCSFQRWAEEACPGSPNSAGGINSTCVIWRRYATNNHIISIQRWVTVEDHDFLLDSHSLP